MEVDVVSKKYFTLEEANRLLPEMKVELEALQTIKHRFESRYIELQRWKKHGRDEMEIFSLECELDFLQIESKTHIQNIFNRGVELKDIELGLIDFPAIIEGEEMLLCWKLGETGIRFCHGIHEGFSGRKRIKNKESGEDASS
jgi:hypothetical protein